MSATKPLAAVRGYLGANIRNRSQSEKEASLPSITITRQTGSRAVSIGKRLLDRLQSMVTSNEPDWRFFEKDLIQFVLRQSELPESFAKYYPEDSTTYLSDTVEDIVGLHPTAYKINQKCHQTIMQLCKTGHVIVVGRCANLLTSDLPNTLHLRLVGSIETRTRHVMDHLDTDKATASAYVRKEDKYRQRYAKANFNQSNVDDPLLYDMVLNTDNLSDPEAVGLIEQAMKAKSMAHAY